jgi:hypothetical protein
MIKLARYGLVFTFLFAVLSVMQFVLNIQQPRSFQLLANSRYIGSFLLDGMFVILGLLLFKLRVSVVTVMACWSSIILMLANQIVSFVMPLNASYLIVSSLVILITNVVFYIGLLVAKSKLFSTNFKWLAIALVVKILAGAMFPAVFAITGMRWVLYLIDLFSVFPCLAFYFFFKKLLQHSSNSYDNNDLPENVDTSL